MIRADVNAEDHINAKARPISIARMSKGRLSGLINGPTFSQIATESKG